MKLLVCLLITFIAAAVGAWASLDAKAFYAALDQPAWAPPAWVFGPVWTLLYLAMAIAAWLVWRRAGFDNARSALLLYVLQLTANAAWSVLFFGRHLGGWAFADILVLLVLLVMTVAAFWRLRPMAAALLIPYLAWVMFAAVLNYSVWQRNPGALG